MGGGQDPLSPPLDPCFQKNEYFLGYEDFVDIFWGLYKIGLYLGVIYAFQGLFLRSRYRMGDIFGGCLKFLIFFGGER